MFAGTASQTSSTRWGDYSMTTADPSNNTDFWHVNEYATGGAAWHTRIGKFNFVGGGGSPTPTPTASPSATPTSTPAACTWSAGPDMPTLLVRAVGVFFPANGNFYTMGGRTSDTAGSDFQHALQFSPGSNSWTQRPSTFPDNPMNNMACGVLTVSGTPQIYCVGGSAAGQTTATARVFSTIRLPILRPRLPVRRLAGRPWAQFAGWLCGDWQQTIHPGRVQYQRSVHEPDLGV